MTVVRCVILTITSGLAFSLAAKEAKYPWRGYMLDVSRHFFRVSDVKKTLVQMSRCHLNVFHFHLTDNRGWRLEIDKYPNLTKEGATCSTRRLRVSTMDRSTHEGTYGPYFYTKAQMRDIIDTAKRLGIEVVPEIEIPGHSLEVARAYPQFVCAGLKSSPDLCVGSDAVMKFYEDVLDEVCELFPGKFIHIGGDECQMKNWKACADCQARKAKHALKDEIELHYWYMRHFCEYLEKKGRRAVLWGDVMRARKHLPKSAVIMAYNGVWYGKLALRAGHEVVFCPAPCYFDYSQDLEGDRQEYQPFGGKFSAVGLRTFDPALLVEADIRSGILGSQGCMWTELVPDFAGVEWRTWPRLAALAYVLKNGPVEDEGAFREMLEKKRAELLSDGVNAAPLGPLTVDQRSRLVPPPRIYRKKGGLSKLLDCPLDRRIIEWDATKLGDRYRRIYAKKDPALPSGGYRLFLQPKMIRLEVSDDAGIERALTALRQMQRPKMDGTMEFDGCEIED